MPILHYLRSKFNNSKQASLRTKLLLMFVVISILPIVIIQTISYHLANFYIEEKVNMLTGINLFHIKTNIESDLDYYKETAYRIAVDDNIVHLEESFNQGTDVERALSRGRIWKGYASYCYTKEEIRGITFVNKDLQSVYYDKKNFSTYNPFWDNHDDATKAGIYSKIINSNGIVLLPTMMNVDSAERSDERFYMGLRVRNIRTKEDIGIIIMSITEKRLDTICNIEQTENLTKNHVNVYSFIIDDNGRIISFRDNKYIGAHIKEYANNGDTSELYSLNDIINQIPEFFQKRIIINDTFITGTNWRVISVVDKDSMFYEVDILKNLTLGISLLIILISIVLILIFTNRFYDSVNRIVTGIKKAKKGDLQARVVLNTDDELSFIGNEFNEMVVKINALVEDIRRQGEHIYEISDQCRKAEIEALVSQVNPHFLYNTLDCINWMALRKDEYGISTMISNLAQILRYSIGKVNEQVPLYYEIEWLKKYTYLQQVRFNHSFVLKLDIDEMLLDCKIYKLLLQPLVENAIIHGFKDYDSGRELVIRIHRYQDHHLKIAVADNGCGIPQEQVSRLLGQDKPDKIGINNVWQRIQIYYGKSATMNITSNEGEGTTISLIIPLLRWENKQ
ncbi:sensor histidine kinase [Pelosinus sp. IPA-1]|uniref:sensor histidine kinase n=1 Tax=Pelosinus sp. IPA-1 TaxID=3029569 RepID=UPI002436189A|nr:sensor histidine kinase [Pelosinus sp. IPA-1]GMB01144.1 histidine kinase [Pelosinus sp. IPA-1]